MKKWFVRWMSAAIPTMSKKKQPDPSGAPDELFGRVISILDQARGNVVRAVNTNMVHAYWWIGREIVEELQGGEERAAYGKKVVEDLSARLTERYGKGFSAQTLWKFRLFYQAYSGRLSILSPLGIELGALQKSYPAGSQFPQGFSPQLTWSHYRALMRVDKCEFLRANGATYVSLGQRPRFARHQHDSALKGRHHCHHHWVALSGLEWINAITPRALPWAGMDRPVGAGINRPCGAFRTRLAGATYDSQNLCRLEGATCESSYFFRANGATYDSPGQRPGKKTQLQIQALKGRSNRCHSPSPASTFTSFSAQRIASLSSTMQSGLRSTPTWPRCFKTSGVFQYSSTQWKATSICFSIYPARWQLAKRSRMLKNLRPTGSKPRKRDLGVLRGNQGMERLQFPNRTLIPSGNTSPVSASITATRRSRRNTANSSKGMVSPMTRDMYGIDFHDHNHWVALSGLKWINAMTPRALPWVGMDYPVGAGLIESNLEDQADV